MRTPFSIEVFPAPFDRGRSPGSLPSPGYFSVPPDFQGILPNRCFLPSFMDLPWFSSSGVFFLVFLAGVLWDSVCAHFVVSHGSFALFVSCVVIPMCCRHILLFSTYSAVMLFSVHIWSCAALFCFAIASGGICLSSQSGLFSIPSVLMHFVGSLNRCI